VEGVCNPIISKVYAKTGGGGGDSADDHDEL